MEDLISTEINFVVSGKTIQKAIRNYISNDLGINKSFVENIVKERIDRLFTDNNVYLREYIKEAIFTTLVGKKDYWGKIYTPSNNEMREYIENKFNEIIRKVAIENLNIKVGLKEAKDSEQVI